MLIKYLKINWINITIALDTIYFDILIIVAACNLNKSIALFVAFDSVRIYSKLMA